MEEVITKRAVPNVLITGTPGVGKSTLCKRLSQLAGMQWLEISKIAEHYDCLEADSFDAEYGCPVLNEDKLLDMLEGIMCKGGNIVDYHSCDFFPKRWFDIVFVLRTDNTTLYDRLKARGYSGKKLEDNIDCEIFQTILEEARSSYNIEIVHELKSTHISDCDENLTKITQWLQNWISENKASTSSNL